jgi:hypothetical protein
LIKDLGKFETIIHTDIAQGMQKIFLLTGKVIEVGEQIHHHIKAEQTYKANKVSLEVADD